MPSSTGDGIDRATTLRDAVESAPDTVDVHDVVDLLVHGDQRPRDIAFEAYRELVRIRPQAADSAVARLETHLTDSSAGVRRRGALTAAVLVEHHPEQFEQVVPALCSIGDDLAEPGREAAVLTLAKLALERPTSAITGVDTLVTMCLDRVTPADPTTGRGLPDAQGVQKGPESHDRKRRDEVRVHAVAGLTKIAAEDPDSVRESLPAVADLLTDDNHLVRAAACEIFEAVATTYPGDVAPYASEFATRVASDTTQPVPWRAADALVTLSETRPDCVGAAVAPIAEGLSKFLESSDVKRRRAGVTLLATAAEIHPEAVEPLTPTLLELVEDDDASVRERVVFVLGSLGVRDARAVRADCAETDPAVEVREAAARTLDRFRRSTGNDG